MHPPRVSPRGNIRRPPSVQGVVRRNQAKACGRPVNGARRRPGTSSAASRPDPASGRRGTAPPPKRPADALPVPRRRAPAGEVFELGRRGKAFRNGSRRRSRRRGSPGIACQRALRSPCSQGRRRGMPGEDCNSTAPARSEIPSAVSRENFLRRIGASPRIVSHAHTLQKCRGAQATKQRRMP